MVKVKVFQIHSERRIGEKGERYTTLASASEKVLGDFLADLNGKDIINVVQTVENSSASHGGSALFTIIYNDAGGK